MKKTRTIQVRLNGQEYQELLQKCSQSKMQLSMFVRSCLAEAKVTEMGHKQEMVPLIMEMYSILNQMPEMKGTNEIKERMDELCRYLKLYRNPTQTRMQWSM